MLVSTFIPLSGDSLISLLVMAFRRVQSEELKVKLWVAGTCALFHILQIRKMIVFHRPRRHDM